MRLRERRPFVSIAVGVAIDTVHDHDDATVVSPLRRAMKEDALLCIVSAGGFRTLEHTAFARGGPENRYRKVLLHPSTSETYASSWSAFHHAKATKRAA